MSAVVMSRTFAVPRGASAFERFSIRLAESIAGWAAARAERRADAHEAMLRQIERAQTAHVDPRTADHLLAQMGAPRR